MKYIYQKGVTLVELLIVMAIIAILAGAIVTAINPVAQLQKGRDAKRKGDLQQLRAALEQYRADKGSYPVVPNGQYYVIDCTASNNAFTDGATNTYIQHVPCDPTGSSFYNGGNYAYLGTTGTTYTLAACLERNNDPEGTSNATVPNGIPTNNCSSNLFYIVNNP